MRTRQHVWIVRLIDKPEKGEDFMTREEIRAQIRPEAGVRVSSVKRSTPPSSASEGAKKVVKQDG